MNQKIRFTSSPDSTRIAYAESGAGPPLVKAANWLSHLEFDWQSPLWRHWQQFFSSQNRLIRYDPRGCGLSDWEAADLSLSAQVADLEAVIDAAGADRFPLVGISQGGPVAVEYTLRHPEKVSHLILYGAFARGWKRRDDESSVQFTALNNLMRLGWGQENPAFRRLFTSLFVPEANDEQERWFGDLMRITSHPEIAARVLAASADVDVSHRLAEVNVPTLVIHVRNDACVPYSQGREYATGIPRATFVTLESRNHILLDGEPAWLRFKAEFGQFVGHRGISTDRPPLGGSECQLEQLTTRERAILAHVAHGLSNAEIAGCVFISEKTVRNHLTSIFAKLGVDSRAKAIVLARERGFDG